MGERPPAPAPANPAKRPNSTPRSADLRNLLAAKQDINGTAGSAIAGPAGSIYRDSAWVDYELLLRNLVKEAIRASRGKGRGRRKAVVILPPDLPAPPAWDSAWPPSGNRTRLLVFAYIRVSSNAQGRRASPSDQVQDILRLAYLLGYTIVGIFVDEHTGKTFDRPSFKIMRKMLPKSIAGGIVVTHMNRWTRTSKMAVVLMVEFSDLGAPLNYWDDFSKRELVVADMDDPELLKRATSAAVEAERSWEEHQKKTRMGIQSSVNLGILDREPKDPYLFFFRERQDVGLARDRYVLQAKPDGRRIWLSYLNAIRKDPTSETIKKLATAASIKVQTFIRHLRAPMIVGLFQRNTYTSENIIAGLAVGTIEEFEEMERLLDSTVERSNHFPAKQPVDADGEPSIVEELIANTSVEYAERVSGGTITILCDELVKGVPCGKPTSLNAANIAGKRRDRRYCGEHRTLHPKQGVYMTLADGPGPYCIKCGMFEHVATSLSRRVNGTLIYEYDCSSCKIRWRSTWNGSPPGRRAREAREKATTKQQTLQPKQQAKLGEF